MARRKTDPVIENRNDLIAWFDIAKTWSPAEIENYARKNLLIPESYDGTAPVFDKYGAQLRNIDGSPKAMHHKYVELFNSIVVAKLRRLYIDISRQHTMSYAIADCSLLLGAVDVFAITKKDVAGNCFLLMGVRSKFQKTSSVGASGVYDSASGFRALIDGTLEAETPVMTAQRELRQELGLSVPANQFEPVHDGVNLERLLHYLSLETTSKRGRFIKGYRPTFSHAYATELSFGLRDVIDKVTLSTEHDGVVAVPLSDGLKVLSGSTKQVRAILYPSERLQGYKLSRKSSIKNIFSGADLRADFDPKARAKLLDPALIVLKKSDCSLNGSNASGQVKTRMLGKHFYIPA